MRYRPPVSGLTGYPSPGALLGAVGNSMLLQSFSNNSGHTFVSANNDPIWRRFQQDFTRPLIEAAQAMAASVAAVQTPDAIRMLSSIDEFEHLPAAMQLPLLTYQPIRELLEAGLIHGFGAVAETLPEEDVYGRLINNGYVEDVAENIAANNGVMKMTFEYASDDPSLTPDELEALSAMRQIAYHALVTTPFDPTDYPNYRG